jgi:uncharacterized OB-fold protein
MSSGIEIQRCRRCDRRWVLPRPRCPQCGAVEIDRVEARGRGRVFAATLVHRAPDEAFAAITPYRIALVDLDEGPRLMAHLRRNTSIGSRVSGRVEMVAGRSVPVFAPDSDRQDEEET